MTDARLHLPGPVGEAEILGECSICITILTAEVAFQLSACGHLFHRLCLRGLLRHAFSESSNRLVDLGRRRLVNMLCPNCRRTVSREDVLNLQIQTKLLTFHCALRDVTPDAQYKIWIRLLGSRRQVLLQRPVLRQILPTLSSSRDQNGEKSFSVDVKLLVDNPVASYVVRMVKIGPTKSSLITEKTYPPSALMSLEKDATEEKIQQLQIDASLQAEEARQWNARFDARTDTWEYVPDTPRRPVRTHEVFDISAASSPERSSPDLPSPSELFASSSPATLSRPSARRRLFTSTSPEVPSVSGLAEVPPHAPAESRRPVFSAATDTTVTDTTVAEPVVPREPRPGPSRDSHWTDETTVDTSQTGPDNGRRDGSGKRTKLTEKILKKRKRRQHKFEKLEKKLRSNVENMYKNMDVLFQNMTAWQNMDVELHGTEGKSTKYYAQMKKNKRELYSSIQCLSKCFEKDILEE